MIKRALGFSILIGLFVTIGTVFLFLILPMRGGQTNFTAGLPYPWLRWSSGPFMCIVSFAGKCPTFTYEIIWQNLLIDWGIFSFIFFLLLIILYKANVLK
jgi:hypothetical protein